MKIGILTYHFAINYGALLQCYALQKALESRGADCEVCDFQSPVQRDNNRLYSKQKNPKAMAKNLCKLPFHFARKAKQQKFRRFLEENLKLSRPLATLEDLQQEAQGLDVLVCGSDQVFSPRISDFNEAFFLPFPTKAKKASYAASLGKSEAKELEPYKDALGDFDYLTLREASSLPDFRKLGLAKVEIAPDPVFLLPAEQWRTLAKADTPVIQGKYLLCYFLNVGLEQRYLQRAKEMAKRKQLKLYRIVSRYRPYNLSGSAICHAGPEEFLNLIANAAFVCTDSFHGTVFSSLFGVDFLTFCPTKHEPDQRKQEVLKALGLEDRLCYADEPMPHGPEGLRCPAQSLAAQRARGFAVIEKIMNLK